MKNLTSDCCNAQAFFGLGSSSLTMSGLSNVNLFNVLVALIVNIVMNIVYTTVNASAITYKFQAKLAHSADSVRFHLGDSHTGTGSSIIATEFA